MIWPDSAANSLGEDHENIMTKPKIHSQTNSKHTHTHTERKITLFTKGVFHKPFKWMFLCTAFYLQIEPRRQKTAEAKWKPLVSLIYWALLTSSLFILCCLTQYAIAEWRGTFSFSYFPFTFQPQNTSKLSCPFNPPENAASCSQTSPSAWTRAYLVPVQGEWVWWPTDNVPWVGAGRILMHFSLRQPPFPAFLGQKRAAFRKSTKQTHIRTVQKST